MTFCFLTVRSGVGDLLRHSFYLSSRDSPLVSHFSAVSLSTAQKSLGPLYPTVLSHCRLPSRRWDCFIFHGCVVSFLARISGSKHPQAQPPESLVMVRTARTWSNRDLAPVSCRNSSFVRRHTDPRYGRDVDVGSRSRPRHG